MFKYADVKIGRYFIMKDGSICLKLNRREFNTQLSCVIRSSRYSSGEILTLGDNDDISQILGCLNEIIYEE